MFDFKNYCVELGKDQAYIRSLFGFGDGSKEEGGDEKIGGSCSLKDPTSDMKQKSGRRVHPLELNPLEYEDIQRQIQSKGKSETYQRAFDQYWFGTKQERESVVA
mmetsp:Transcript_12604/g.21205  ORF Transcript_12604/g.21205 Transcript_12604/m.21205 type:complete len:105 (-) Transcript_12604:733-1047(-)